MKVGIRCRLGFVLGVLVATLCLASVGAQDNPNAGSIPGIGQGVEEAKEEGKLGGKEAWDDWKGAWARFRDGRYLLIVASSLLLSAFLAALIAYHPRRKGTTIVELEQPKTFIMYAIVGTICGRLALVDPTMGFVIFGIGGLLRFRTDVGAAKDTGRVILSTVVGVTCGIDLFVLAIFGTVFGWILIYVLEFRTTFRLTVKGLSVAPEQPERIPGVAEAYHKVLTEYGCTIVRERKNFRKGQVAFVFRAPTGYTREDLEDILSEDVPSESRGAEDWETT